MAVVDGNPYDDLLTGSRAEEGEWIDRKEEGEWIERRRVNGSKGGE